MPTKLKGRAACRTVNARLHYTVTARTVPAYVEVQDVANVTATVTVAKGRSGPHISDHGLSYGFRVLIDPKGIGTMKTKPKRKRNSMAFRAKVGLEAVIGIKTVAQIGREYAVHPVQVSQWKAMVRERLSELFEPGSEVGEGPR